MTTTPTTKQKLDKNEQEAAVKRDHPLILRGSQKPPTSNKKLTSGRGNADEYEGTHTPQETKPGTLMENDRERRKKQPDCLPAARRAAPHGIILSYYAGHKNRTHRNKKTTSHSGEGTPSHKEGREAGNETRNTYGE